MTVVVGYLAGKGGASALHLAVGAARSLEHLAGGGHRRPASMAELRHRRASTPNMPSTPHSWRHPRPSRHGNTCPHSTIASTSASTSSRTGSVSGGLLEAVRRARRGGPRSRLGIRRPIGPGGGGLDRGPAAALLPGSVGDQPARLPQAEIRRALARITCAYPGSPDSGGRGAAGDRPGPTTGYTAARGHLRGPGTQHVPADRRAARRGRDPAGMDETGPAGTDPVEGRKGHRRRRRTAGRHRQRLERRHSMPSTGSRVRSWRSEPHQAARSPGFSWARMDRRSCGTARFRFSSSRADRSGTGQYLSTPRSTAIWLPDRVAELSPASNATTSATSSGAMNAASPSFLPSVTL